MMEMNFDELHEMLLKDAKEAMKAKENIDNLVHMRLEEDEVQACMELVEKMREEKRLAAKREKAKTKLTEAVYGMVELTDVATVRHFLMDILRTIPSD